jgi:hypothetical protein
LFPSAALVLAACASLPQSPIQRGPDAPPPAAAAASKGAMPSAPLDLGKLDAPPETVARRFASVAGQRYPQGAPLAAVEADLRKNGFACAPSKETKGDPPRRICRKIVPAAGCRHTF